MSKNQMSKLIVSPAGEKSKEPAPLLMAFPLFGVAPGQLPGTATVIMQGGMEMRDYFAGQYLAANVFTDHDHDTSTSPLDVMEAVTKEAYLFADSMLKAREAHRK